MEYEILQSISIIIITLLINWLWNLRGDNRVEKVRVLKERISEIESLRKESSEYWSEDSSQPKYELNGMLLASSVAAFCKRLEAVEDVLSQNDYNDHFSPKLMEFVNFATGANFQTKKRGANMNRAQQCIEVSNGLITFLREEIDRLNSVKVTKRFGIT